MKIFGKRNIIKNCESMRKPRGFCEIVELSTTKKSQKKNDPQRQSVKTHVFLLSMNHVLAIVSHSPMSWLIYCNYLIPIVLFTSCSSWNVISNL